MTDCTFSWCDSDLDLYHNDGLVFSDKVLDLADSFVNERATDKDRELLKTAACRELFDEVAKLRKRGLNTGVETLLSILNGKSSVKPSLKSRQSESRLETAALGSSERCEATRKQYYWAFRDLLQQATLSLRDVPEDQKVDLIRSFKFLCAVAYRKTQSYYLREANRRKRTSDVLQTIYENEQRKRVKLGDATTNRITHLYSKDNCYKNDYLETSKSLLEIEDEAFVKSDRGRQQIRGSIDGMTTFHILREVEAIVWNQTRTTNLEDDLSDLDLEDLLPDLDFDSNSLRIPRQYHPSSCIFYIIFVRCSPGTINDGVRQLLAIVAVIQYLRRNGADIEIYPTVFRSNACRHNPFVSPALEQMRLALKSDPFLAGRTARVIAIDGTRFAEDPDDIDTIQDNLQSVHAGVSLTTLHTLYQDIRPYQEVVHEYRIAMNKYSSRHDITTDLEIVEDDTDIQEQVHLETEIIRQDLDDDDLELIAECLHVNEDSNEKARSENARFRPYERGTPLEDVVRRFDAEFDNMEWSGDGLKSHFLYERISVYNEVNNKSTFQHMIPGSTSIMGHKASRLPVKQTCENYAAIKITTGENALENGNVRNFFDCGVPRHQQTKPAMLECLMECYKSKSSDFVVVVSSLSRFGSERMAVTLTMALFENCRRLIVAGQMSYFHLI